MKHEENWLPDLMIRRAESLRRVAEEISRGGEKAGPEDSLLFEGTMLAEPVLLSLAAEIALKAWQCRERSGAPDRDHDLVALFDGLGDESRKRLEEKMPEHESPLRGFPPVYPGMRNALTQCRSVFVEWRYAHEHQSVNAEVGILNTALKAIIQAYDDLLQAEAAGE